MKAQILRAQTGFKPINIELTLETVEEARLFWHICNRTRLKEALFAAKYNTSHTYIEDMADEIPENIHDIIDEAIKSQNIQIEK